jgi:hypothetical protein
MKQALRIHPPGLGSLEAVLVLALVIAITGGLFIGSRHWKRSSDRSQCIANIQTIQLELRAWQNANDLPPGHPLPHPYDEGAPKMLRSDFLPQCPTGASYRLTTHIPAYGEIFATCPATEALKHVPTDTEGW